MNNPTQRRSRIFGIPRRVAGATLALAIALVAAVVMTGSAQAQTYTEGVLYSFTGPPDGANPVAGLVQDINGNLYGTTEGGGDLKCNALYGCGTVFKLDTTGKETVLYRFTGTGGDGINPAADLVLDAQGNLYGTTFRGGNLACPGTNGYGCGTVFKLDTTGKETVLHSFNGIPDGSGPEAGLVLDAQGNLYGTTTYGGSPKCSGCGTVFKVDATGKETVIYSFTGKSGRYPAAGLVMDGQGNLYGTTRKGGGGGFNLGTVFKVDTTGKETVLHSFTGPPDGAHPVAALVLDTQGNLYGTTAGGGTDHDYGMVFKVNTTGSTYAALYNFLGKPDGLNPRARLVRDAQGNLYGTTLNGGTAPRPGFGTVFKLDTTGKETVLYSFSSFSNGLGAWGGLVLDAQGNLYGTTSTGGDPACNAPSGCGTVFKLTPAP
jgi:uncharacterized repeat protein (TIGR03803 family)